MSLISTLFEMIGLVVYSLVSIWLLISTLLLGGLIGAALMIFFGHDSDSSDHDNETKDATTTSTTTKIKQNILQSSFDHKVTQRLRIMITNLYRTVVVATSSFISDVLSQPTTQHVVTTTIVHSINKFIDQEDFAERIAGASTSVMLDQDRRRIAAHSVGKDVVPMVTGFVGGVASSLRPGNNSKTKKHSRRNLSPTDSKTSSSRRHASRSDITDDETDDTQSNDRTSEISDHGTNVNNDKKSV